MLIYSPVEYTPDYTQVSYAKKHLRLLSAGDWEKFLPSPLRGLDNKHGGQLFIWVFVFSSFAM